MPKCLECGEYYSICYRKKTEKFQCAACSKKKEKRSVTKKLTINTRNHDTHTKERRVCVHIKMEKSVKIFSKPRICGKDSISFVMKTENCRLQKVNSFIRRRDNCKILRVIYERALIGRNPKWIMKKIKNVRSGYRDFAIGINGIQY